MEPTDEEAAGITDVAALFAWAGLAEGEARTALFQLVGLEAADHWRVFARMAASDLQELLARWRIGEDPPSLAQASKAQNAHHAARVLAKLEVPAAVTTQARMQPQPAPPPAAAGTGDTVQLSTVCDQTSNREVPKLSDEEVTRAYGRYTERMGSAPAEEEEPTTEQLTAVAHLLASQVPPYVDFALFGPHQQRLRKRLRFTGLQLAADGSLRHAELLGPPTLEDWESCYRILSTCLIMFDAVTPACLDRYRYMIADFIRFYSPTAWSIVYQADVRMRLEHMQSLRRRALTLISERPDEAARLQLTPEKPWDWVWKQAVWDSEKFWNRQVVTPCLLVLSRSANLTRLVDGDASVPMPSGGSRAGSSTVDTAASLGAATGRSDKGSRAVAQPPAATKVHSVGQDGRMTANRAGRALCAAFQSGGCKDTIHGSLICAADQRSSHQCAVCLSPQHGASHPTPCTRQAHAPKIKTFKPGGRGGRGRGKGKGRAGAPQY